uniref:Uncharacterized protein n=1 Tax=Cyanoderma ruficeps TaxID=181631 RepID=A0A8C3XGW5_9PASS
MCPHTCIQGLPVGWRGSPPAWGITRHPWLTWLCCPVAEKTGKVLGEFCRCYKEQFGVALFNSVRYEIEGAGGPQPQLLHRKVPLEDHVIYSGNIFQYIEENKKWRNRFCVVPHNYGLVLYENKVVRAKPLPPTSSGVIPLGTPWLWGRYLLSFPLEPGLMHRTHSFVRSDPVQGVVGDSIRRDNSMQGIEESLRRSDPVQGAEGCPRRLSSGCDADPSAQLQPPLPSPAGRAGRGAPSRQFPSAPVTRPSLSPAVKEAAVQRKHNLYRDSMVMHNSDPNLHLLGEGAPIDWSEEYSGQPEAEPAAERRRRAKQVVSVIQDDEGALPYGAEALLQPGSPEPREPEEAHPGVPPSPPDAVKEIREALAQESLGDGAEGRLMNGTEEGPLPAGAARGDGTQQGPARDGDGRHGVASPAPAAEIPAGTGREKVTPALSPVPGAEMSSGTVRERVTPASSPVPGAEVPAGTGTRVTPASSPVPGAEVPAGAGTRRAAPAPPVPGAEVSSGGQCATPASSPVGAEVPSGTGREHPAPASPVPRADAPSEAEVPHATPRSSVPASPVSGADVPSGAEVPHVTPRSSVPASPVSGADVPSGAEVPHVTPRSSVPASPVPGADPPSVSSVPHVTAGGHSPSPACPQRSDNEPGEHGGPRGTRESGEGVQTEF